MPEGTRRRAATTSSWPLAAAMLRAESPSMLCAFNRRLHVAGDIRDRQVAAPRMNIVTEKTICGMI